MKKKVLYVFFGLIASGKSTLSDLFAASHELACYNTDRVRKELAGMVATERRADDMGQGIYTPAFTRKTYQALLDRARRDFELGAVGVVLDGSYSTRIERQNVQNLARELDVSALFILCTCSDDEVKKRLVKRAEDPKSVSDGRWEIYIKQKVAFEYPSELEAEIFMEMNTEQDPRVLLRSINHFIAERS